MSKFRIGSVIVAFTIVMSSGILSDNARAESTVCSEDSESLIEYEEYTQDHDVNSLLVVLKQSSSILNKQWSATDFGTDNIKSIVDLTSMDFSDADLANEYLDQVDFHQILEVYLSDSSAEARAETISEFESCSHVLQVSPNYIVEMASVPNDYPVSDIGESVNLSSYYPFVNTQMYGAWGIETGDSTVKIGIIDSGISPNDDLNDNVSTTYGTNIANNGSFLVDQYYAAYPDSEGHGTAVAGVVGAEGNNANGVCGVMWDATLVSINVFTTEITSPNESSVRLGRVISALSYAASNQIKIVNISIFAHFYMISSLATAIDNYNGLIVMAAGNDHLDLDDADRVASYNADNLIVVAATDANDNLASFSSYGDETVDLAAPGVDMWAISADGTYSQRSGTSFAAPMVAGVAGLLLSRNPNLTPEQLKEAIVKSVDLVPALSGKTISGGRLNAYKALQYIKSVNQLQNIVVNVRVSQNSGISSFEAYVQHNWHIQTFVSLTPGQALPDADALTYQNSILVADPNIRKKYAIYNGTQITSSGTVCTYRFTSNLNQSASDVLSTIQTVSNMSGLTFQVVVIGDVNGDGRISNEDRVLITQFVAEMQTLTYDQYVAADVNFDNIVNNIDAAIINQYVAGTRNSFFS